MPCLNEAETLSLCIDKAQTFLATSGVVGEVIVADNGSTDGSREIARRCGARVVEVPERGYGSALMGGIRAARGRYVIMGDADDSYDFTDLAGFLGCLRAGYDLVMGNRFTGGIRPGAMPPLHRYIGNPVLSGIGRVFFKAPVGDFHCGLRGFRRESILSLDLRTPGMEFASEVVVKACLNGLRITEVPTVLHPDGRSRPPHLRSWRDGWRHLRFLLIFSPKWLFLYPGIFALTIGGIVTLVLMIRPVTLGAITLDVGTMLYSAALAFLGYQAVLFAMLTKVYAAAEGFLPVGRGFQRIRDHLTVEAGVLVGLLLFILGLAGGAFSLLRWGDTEFGQLNAAQTIRTVLPAVLGLIFGFQTILFSMFMGILAVRRSAPKPLGGSASAASADFLPDTQPGD
jgi:hypothetical protein